MVLKDSTDRYRCQISFEIIFRLRNLFCNLPWHEKNVGSIRVEEEYFAGQETERGRFLEEWQTTNYSINAREYMFRVAGKTLLWDGKTRRRTFFSEREFLLFRDRTVVWPSVARLDSPDRGKGKILSRKRKSLRVFPSKCNSFQPYGYIFSSSGPLTNHKKLLKGRLFKMWNPNPRK